MLMRVRSSKSLEGFLTGAKTNFVIGTSTIMVVQSKTAAGLRVLPMTTFVKCELQKWRTITNGISEYVFFNPQQPSRHILCENCLAPCSQAGRDSKISYLPVSRKLRNQACCRRCFRYNH
jgi:hypothetical protein